MTLKDFLWIVRRRILWFIGSLVTVLLLYAMMMYQEQTSYTVTATVVIDVPRELTPFTQGNLLRVYTPPTTLKNWQALLTSRHIKKMTVEALRQGGMSNAADIVASITAAPVATDTTWTRLTASAEDPKMAVLVLNKHIEMAVLFSKKEASEHLREAKDVMEKQIKINNEQSIPDMETKIRDLKEEARAWDIPKKVEAILNTLQGYDDLIDDLNRKKERNAYLIQKMQKDRAAVQHLNRELYPKAVTPTAQISYEILSRSTPYIEQLQQKLLSLRFNYNNLSRKYQREHPEMIGLVQEIRDTESTLSQAKIDALGAHMDREEANFLVQNELHDLEIRSIQQSGAEVQRDYEKILKIEQRYKPLEREYNEIVSRTSAMAHTLDTLKTAIEAQTGYVVKREEANAEEAVQAEKRTTKMGPFILLIAMVLALGACFVVEFLDTSIRSDVDIKRHLNYPMVGIVPRVRPNDVILNRTGDITILSEVFDTIATMIHTVCLERKIRSITITSTNPEEGKTCLSINLAIALARQGRKVTLIDADMRKPAVHSFLGLENTMGFADLLMAARAVDDPATMPSPLELSMDVGIQNLKVIPSGKMMDQPYSLLDTRKMKGMISRLEREMDYIIVDTPPLLLTGDTLKAAAATGLVIFIVESGKTDQKRASWAKHLLTNIGVPVLGAILNKADTRSDQYYYYYYRDRYYRSPQA